MSGMRKVGKVAIMVTAGVVVAVLLEETMMLAGMRLKSIGAFCCFEGVAIVVAKNSAFLLNVYFRVV